MPTRSITAADAAKSHLLPSDVRMLARDFVHNSLYHPSYGYFSKNAYIFSPPEPIAFGNFKDSASFMDHLSKLYKDVEDEHIGDGTIARQVWHTPSELFRASLLHTFAFEGDIYIYIHTYIQSIMISLRLTSERRSAVYTCPKLLSSFSLQPHYGRAVAKHIISQFKSDPRGADRLTLYEVGAGNGTLMRDILDYIALCEPEIYKTVQYNIIEISTKLAGRQERTRSARHISGRHSCVRIINKSVFDWDQVVPEPCFFIAMEVIDNFAHDLVRYDIATREPQQGIVLIGADADFQEAFEPVSDPLIKRYLDIRARTGYVSPLKTPSWSERIKRMMPLAPNMTEREFLPTHSLLLIDRLQKYFPNHRLVVSDFDSLPEAVPGIDGPVVQTRYQGTMVACSTYLVQPGWFDIFFPTNFELLSKVYKEITGRRSEIITQQQFVLKYGDVAATRTKSGENPMVTFYQNFKFILS
eukprot:jgi/Hompol1/5039/HPOL_004131-RA